MKQQRGALVRYAWLSVGVEMTGVEVRSCNGSRDRYVVGTDGLLRRMCVCVRVVG